MRYIIDRFEGELAVLELENGEFVSVTTKILPPNATEGSVINITCDEYETEKKRLAAKKKMDSIFTNKENV
ncbi:MAG: hypothetical protein BWY15_01920 [Firmicutes bacterium ADurb.Bin193]|nr:MAG: hypothetical protein BWY15_01920 [Firmicutes bacterium ADurb.Bin193]